MSDKERPFHNPFAALRGLAGAAPAPAETSKPVPRAVVRLERSGRGGKVVTVVEHMAITASTRDEWLTALKAALGCGGTSEDERLVFQGDQRKRLPALLQARGVRR
jgi:translation initiation factor 1